MRVRFARQATLGLFLIPQCAICFGEDAPDPTDPNRYVNAVREFADNVPKYGRQLTRCYKANSGLCNCNRILSKE